jgi:hypothetical protein
LVLARHRQSSERQDGRRERSWGECLIFRLAIFACTSNFGLTALSANRTSVAFNNHRGHSSHDRVGDSSDVAYGRHSWRRLVVGVVRLSHSFLDFFCIPNWQSFRIHMARSQSSLLAVLCHRRSGHVRALPSFHDHSYGSCAIGTKCQREAMMSVIAMFQQLTDTSPTQPLQMEKCAFNLVSAPLILLLLPILVPSSVTVVPGDTESKKYLLPPSRTTRFCDLLKNDPVQSGSTV